MPAHNDSKRERLRPAVAAPSFDSKRTSNLKRCTLAPSFRRKAAVLQEESPDVTDLERDEENFRNGLKRNIALLSNLTRVNQQELAKLREQLKAKDAEISSLKVEKVDLQETDREGDLGAPHRQDFAGNRTHKLATYANMAVMANKLTSKTRDRLPKTESEPSEQDRVAEDMAVAAMGAKHTEQQLLRASRDMRGQLDRALKEAAALRAENMSSKARANVAEKEKALLEARVAWLSDEVKLQAAPLVALQLDLTQARCDAEVMRQRLQEERKDNRIKVGDIEKSSAEAQQRAERLEFDLNETAKAFQRESLKAAKLDGMFQEASAAASSLKEEVEQRKTDAKRMAQELSRIMLDSEETSALAALKPPAYSSLSGDRGQVVSAEEGQEAMRTQLEEQRVEIATLKTTIAQLRLERAKSDDAVKEKRQMHHAELAKRKRASAEAEDRGAVAAVLSTENSRLRLAIEKHEEQQRDQDNQRKERDAERDKTASEQQLHHKSWRDRIRRTLDELCAAEEAGELVLTCLKCARLFKDPYVMAPCGHTLCAECCGGGKVELPDEESSGWVLGDGGGKSAKRETPGCEICGQEDQRIEAKAERVGMAPNRALATLVVKFAFRRKLLETLKEIV